MKKIFESNYTQWGWATDADMITVYALESEEEYWKIFHMNHEERRNLIHAVDVSDNPLAGAVTVRAYIFELIDKFFVVVKEMIW